MTTNKLDNLIEQFSNVRIQEKKVKEQARILEEKADIILQKIKTFWSRSIRVTSRPIIQDSGFEIGDYVFIANKITSPPGREVNLNDRKAIVTRIDHPWIHFRTLNGFDTKRYAKNLKKIPNSSQHEY